MLLPKSLERVSFHEFLPLELPLVRAERRKTLRFKGRLLGQDLQVDNSDTELPSAMVRVFQARGRGFITYLAHFSLTRGLWEANHAVTEQLDLGKISNGLHLETAVLGDGQERVTITNVPTKCLARALYRALRNWQIVERKRR